MLKNVVVGSHGSSTFGFVRNLHTGFHSGHTDLRFHQQCGRVWPFPLMLPPTAWLSEVLSHQGHSSEIHPRCCVCVFMAGSSPWAVSPFPQHSSQAALAMGGLTGLYPCSPSLPISLFSPLRGKAVLSQALPITVQQHELFLSRGSSGRFFWLSIFLPASLHTDGSHRGELIASCCSVTKPSLTLGDPMNCRPGFPVHHYLPVSSNSCPLSQWCHPTISSSVVPFSSCPQSFPTSGSFPVSWLFT